MTAKLNFLWKSLRNDFNQTVLFYLLISLHCHFCFVRVALILFYFNVIFFKIALNQPMLIKFITNFSKSEKKETKKHEKTRLWILNYAKLV